MSTILIVDHTLIIKLSEKTLWTFFTVLNYTVNNGLHSKDKNLIRVTTMSVKHLGHEDEM